MARLHPVLAALLAATLSASTCVASSPRVFPSVVNAGYASTTNATKIVEAVRQGLNVLFWFSINLGVDADGRPQIQGGPNLTFVGETIAQLRRLNLTTVNMISVGGWDAPHPDTSNPAAAVWTAWREWNEGTVASHFPGGFDGIDWDLEGNDDVSSPWNEFTPACIELVGELSQAAKRDGYFITLVPPESYLDPTTSLFDRSLLHAYPEWHPEFQYHGHNVYAAWQAKYGSTTLPSGGQVRTFDAVMIQLYETWSHADYNTTARTPRQTGAQYLAAWVPRVVKGWYVDFTSDPAVGIPGQVVSVPATQLIIGLANAWAGNPRSVLIMPEEVGKAWAVLKAQGMAPLGCVYWTINNEGDVPPGQTEPLFMAAGLNAFLHTRP